MIARLLCYSLLFLAGASWAGNNILINSGRQEFFVKKNTSIFTDKVHISLDTSVIDASFVEIKNLDASADLIIRAYGNPLTCIAVVDSKKTIIHANSLVYFGDKKLFFLNGSVNLLQGQNNFHGDNLIYDTKNQQIIFSSDYNNDSVVKSEFNLDLIKKNE